MIPMCFILIITPVLKREEKATARSSHWKCSLLFSFEPFPTLEPKNFKHEISLNDPTQTEVCSGVPDHIFRPSIVNIFKELFQSIV